ALRTLACRLMADLAVSLEHLLPFAEWVITQPGLVFFKFLARFVRLVNQRIEPAAVFVQETHAPKGQDRDQDEQPNRRLSRVVARFNFLRFVRWVRVGVHWGGALVVPATGELVVAATATVIGVSKMTVSARKLM